MENGRSFKAFVRVSLMTTALSSALSPAPLWAMEGNNGDGWSEVGRRRTITNTGNGKQVAPYEKSKEKIPFFFAKNKRETGSVHRPSGSRTGTRHAATPIREDIPQGYPDQWKSLSVREMFDTKKTLDVETAGAQGLFFWMNAIQACFDDQNFVAISFARTLNLLSKRRDVRAVHHYLKERPQWTKAFFETSGPKLGAFEPQAFANTIHGLGKLEVTPPKDWTAAFFDASRPQLKAFKPQELANTIYGLGKLEVTLSKDWTAAFFDASRPQLGAFEPQAFANTIHGLGKLEVTPPKDWTAAFFEASRPQLKAFNVQNLSNTVHGLGKLEVTLSKDWIKAFFEASRPQLEAFNPQDFANTIHGLGKLEVTPPKDWTAAFFNASRSQLEAFKSQELSNTIYGLGKLEVMPSEDWTAAFFKASGPQLEAFNPQDFANTIYGLGKLDVVPQEVWMQAWKAYWQKTIGSKEAMSVEDLHQVAVMQSYYRVVHKFDLGLFMNDALLKRRAVTTSQFQRNVLNVLKKHGAPGVVFQEEVWIPELYTHGDIGIVGRKVIIQVDGPSHFLPDGTYNSDTRFQTKFLEKCGYQVHRISLKDWSKIATSSEKDQRAWVSVFVGTGNKPVNQLSVNAPAFSPSTSSGLRASAVPFTPPAP